MEKPDQFEKIPKGQLFQISPEGTNSLSVEYGGDFLIGNEYYEWGVQGYIASLYEHPGIIRFQGLAYLMVRWEFLEFVGSCFWFKEKEKDEEVAKVQQVEK